jgi:hypothetical protein
MYPWRTVSYRWAVVSLRTKIPISQSISSLVARRSSLCSQCEHPRFPASTWYARVACCVHQSRSLSDLHGHITSRPTPAHHHLNSAHHGRDIWFAATPASLKHRLTHSSPVVLYKRLVLGEPQRKLPHPGQDNTDRKIIEFGRED